VQLIPFVQPNKFVDQAEHEEGAEQIEEYLTEHEECLG